MKASHRTALVQSRTYAGTGPADLSRRCYCTGRRAETVEGAVVPSPSGEDGKPGTKGSPQLHRCSHHTMRIIAGSRHLVPASIVSHLSATARLPHPTHASLSHVLFLGRTTSAYWLWVIEAWCSASHPCRCAMSAQCCAGLLCSFPMMTSAVVWSFRPKTERAPSQQPSCT